MPSMTITTNAQDAAKLADAVGWALGLNGAATNAQVREYTIAQLRHVWRVYKRHVDEQAIAEPTEITPT